MKLGSPISLRAAVTAPADIPTLHGSRSTANRSNATKRSNKSHAWKINARDGSIDSSRAARLGTASSDGNVRRTACQSVSDGCQCHLSHGEQSAAQDEI